MDDRNVWERQPEETAKAYDAFTIYKEAGASRSLVEVSRKCNKSASLIGRWSRVWQWEYRVRRYDDYMDEQRRKETEAAAIEAYKRSLDLVETIFNIAEDYFSKLDPESLKPAEVVQLLRASAEMARAAREFDTDRMEKSISSSGTLADVVQAAWTRRALSGEL